MLGALEAAGRGSGRDLWRDTNAQTTTWRVASSRSPNRRRQNGHFTEAARVRSASTVFSAWRGGGERALQTGECLGRRRWFFGRWGEGANAGGEGIAFLIMRGII